MRKLGLASLSLVLIAFILSTEIAAAQTRIKDIASFLGVRENQLVGLGLVVGLAGTGDSTQNLLGPHALANLAERSGITLLPRDIRSKNTAVVTVQAVLPPFARPGSKMDVLVSSIGDATSLQGGVLLQTALRAADGRVSPVAQGPVSVGGFAVRSPGGASLAQRNHVTAGRIPNGALVEREVPFRLRGADTLTLVLNQSDFTTAARVVEAINRSFKAKLAQALDSRTVEIKLAEGNEPGLVEFIAKVEAISLSPDHSARVIINEKTGTVAFGGELRIGPVSVIHGNFTVSVATAFDVSQPAPLAPGQTVVVPQERVQASEEKGRSLTVKPGASVEEVVRGLVSIGATPRDVISILQAIKAAGALNADIEII